MKKATWLLGAAAAALLASGAPLTIKAAGPGESQNANLTTTTAGFELTADTDTAVANSVAQFSIDPGTLALKEVPNLHFTNGKVSDLTGKAATLQLLDGTVDPGTPGYDGSSDKKIQVLDYRGTNTGWTLNAKLGDFSNTKTIISPTSLTLTGSVVADDDSGSLNNVNIVGQGATVLSPAADHGSGSTVVTLTSAPLELPKTLLVTPGQYRAQITWTLEAMPVPDSSNGQ
ncbi:WxL domain-containing protein [Lacticaseibacillus jixianensis]|uniref:WxL domain-containing protein n=1 Tax=Lacticaseibacillus jixianensis TaxID=2486012 RepID=A0ABW4BB48_9LACO|nr:WxL domain-containing protein [Lacticaseibacillus jixianensis]